MDYSIYQHSYDEQVLRQWENKEVTLDLTGVTNLLYGFTFTPDYARGQIAQALSMDYWKENSPVYRRMINNLARYHDDSDNMTDEEVDAAIADYIRARTADGYDVTTTQELLLMQAIEATGDGKTPDSALCVIDVGQEYEYIKRKYPLCLLTMTSQSVSNGIDRLQFADNMFGIEAVYFDIRRKFEVGYPNSNEDTHRSR